MPRAASIASATASTASILRTEGIHVREWSQGHLDSRYIKSVYQQFTGKRLKHFPLIPVTTLVFNIVLHMPKNVFMLDYFDYDKQAAKRLLMERYGWEDYGGKHYESVYTQFYQGWILPHKFGYDKRRMHLSTLVCSGEMTRERGPRGDRPAGISARDGRAGQGIRRKETRHLRRGIRCHHGAAEEAIHGLSQSAEPLGSSATGMDLFRFLKHKLHWVS